MKVTANLNRFRKKIANCYDTMALFIDKPTTQVSQNQCKSKVVKKVEQATNNDTRSEQDNKTTLNLDNVNYDVNTGVSTVASDRKS